MKSGRQAEPTSASANDPLTIIHIVRAPVGGIFRHIRDLALAQTRAGHRVGIICDARTGGAFENKQIAELTAKLAFGVTRIPMRRTIGPGDLMTVRRIDRICRAIGPDILHAHGAKGGACGRLVGAMERLRGHAVRVYYAPHGGSLHYNPGSVAGRLYFAIERAMERLTDGLIHVSGHEAAAYRAKVGPPGCAAHIVHNGLAGAEFKPVEAAPGAADFLYIGVLRDLKGVDLFIDALASLHACGFAATARIVGSGEPADERRYRRRVESLGLAGAVTFHAPMPARRAFAGCRTIVVPSRAESFPYIVLEAAAAGLPMIATAVGGIPEIFARQADRLVPPGDVAALQTAMIAVLTDRKAAAAGAKKLRQSLKSRFTLPAMARRTEAIYRGAPVMKSSRQAKSGLVPVSEA